MTGSSEDGVPLVELRAVTREYDPGPAALAGVDLTLWRGEAVAIVGRSGSGKSTLLNILGLLDSPSSGQVLIDGQRVDDDSDRRLSHRRSVDLGFVFQRAHLIGALSARENVLLGLRYANVPDSDAGPLADDALRAVELGEKLNAAARTLSGGEMQRVAIARTLARPASLWLADEPTGNLDSAQSGEIIELLRRAAAARGACLVVVTHEPEIAERMDRVVTLSDGLITSDTGAGPTPLERPSETPPRHGLGAAARARRTLRFIGQSVSAFPRRAWSGIAAAALAVALALTALGLAQSASAQVTSVFDAQRATQVTARTFYDPNTPPRWPLDPSPVASFAGVEGIEYWQTRETIPITNGAVAANNGTLVTTTAAPGRITESSITWASGHPEQIGTGEVVLGATLSKRLGVSQLDVAPEIEINGARYRVVGILTTSRVPFAGGAAFVSDDSAAALPPSTTSIVFAVTVPGGARGLADNIKLLLDPYDSRQIDVDPVLTPDAFRGQLEQNVATSLQLLAVIAGLAGLVAVVFVNVLAVGSRTAEFGVRRAFGARRRELVTLVVGESSLLGALGALLGLGIGFLAIMTVTAIAKWQPVFDPKLLLIPLGGALLFGTLGGLAPAVLAGRIQPADAVRA